MATTGPKFVRVLRCMIRAQPGYLGRLTQAIGDVGANIGDIVKVRPAGESNVRDIEVEFSESSQLDVLEREIGRLDGVAIMNIVDPVLQVHRGGKVRMRSIVPLERPGDVQMVYTPGVATACLEIQREPERVYDYTSLGSTVAIITNGTAILGLGNIGVHAGLPVMEGKAVLFDRLAGLSGVPILLPTRDVRTFVDAVIQISPSFGAIQLEDIAAPECFEIEDRLTEALPIPVMHDDQHGTAVVVLAALINATRASGLQIDRVNIGVIGLGAAGTGIARLLQSYGCKAVLGTDINQKAMQRLERLGGVPTDLANLMAESQIVLATTGRPGLITPELVRNGQIILALSNPNPEISPELAREAGAAFAADGRSVNNALGFPGIFRGTLDARARRINDEMKIAAAETIAQYAEDGELVPSLLNRDVHQSVADAVESAARTSGVTEPADQRNT